MRPAPKTLEDVARDVRGGADLTARLAEFLDAFYGTADPAARTAMLEAPPTLLGAEREDAWLAAAAEHLARRWRLPIPGWAAGEDRAVSTPWFVGRMGVALAPLLLAESPIAFRRRRIFTEAEPLRRARMPAG